MISPVCYSLAVPYAAFEALEFRHNSAIGVQFSAPCDVSFSNQNGSLGFPLMFKSIASIMGDLSACSVVGCNEYLQHILFLRVHIIY